MKDFILNILRGMVIGLSNVIPGVSGGTMMVSMGIYDRLILVLTHFIKKFKEAVMLVMPLGIGMLLAIAIFSKIFSQVLFPNYPLQTNLFFIGLIIGGLPVIYKKVKGKKTGFGSILAFALFFVLVVGMAMMGEGVDAGAEVTVGIGSMVKLFFVGMVAAGTMVIPGVSGSMVMMILGYYNTILDTINAFIDALRVFDFAGMFLCCTVLVPFGIGMILGIVVVAKFIEFILKKYSQIAYWAIIGLIVASPFAILLMMEVGTVGIVEIVTGIIMLAVGFFIAMKLGGE